MWAEVEHFLHPYPLQTPNWPDTPAPSSDGSGMCVDAPPETPNLLSGRQRPGWQRWPQWLGQGHLEKSSDLTATM